MRGINKCIFIGTAGRDPESKTFANGGSVTNLSIAVNEQWKDRDGNKQERVEWVQLVFHNKLGEIAAQYLKKGSPVYVEGSMKTRKWQDRDGNDKYTTEIHVSEMQMLGSKGDRQESRGHSGGEGPASDPIDDIPF